MKSAIVISGPNSLRHYCELAKTGWRLNLQSAPHTNPKRAPKLKTKFSCESCGQNAWGKPDLAIICKRCGIDMRAAKTEAPVIAVPLPSNEPITLLEPAKRKRGRPKGSKNKPPAVAALPLSYDTKQQSKRGRAKGSKNKPKNVVRTNKAA